jgi:hypothetical protein
MILTYVVHNTTDNDFPLEPGEAWKFIVAVEDEYDAYMQIEKVKTAAIAYGHKIMNVYLDNARFDARSYWTDGANGDDFEYQDDLKIDQVRDETKERG